MGERKEMKEITTRVGIRESRLRGEKGERERVVAEVKGREGIYS